MKKNSVIPAKAGIQEIKTDADELLSYMRDVTEGIADLEARANAEMAEVTARYGAWLNPLRDELAARGKELIALMKKNKGVLFAGTDVIDLTNGSLIRETGEKVSIPKTALETCEKLKFNDVIKIVKSLDRPAIEKWPDAKLVLIGAQRKAVEEYKYNIKTVKRER